MSDTQSNEIIPNSDPEETGSITSSVSGAFWQSYEKVKDNSYLQSGIEKSISTVSYLTPTVGKQYYYDASDALTKMYSSPTQSISEGKQYLGGKLYDGKDYIGGKLTGGKEMVSNAKERVGTQLSSGADYVKDKLSSNAEYVESTRVGQAVKSGMDKGLTAVDGVIEYLMPLEGGECESREEGVWEHGKEVTSKAKDRITSIVANRCYQTGDYLTNKYTKGKENIDMVKGYAYDVTIAKGSSIGQQFKYGRDYLEAFTMIQKLAKNFGEAVISTEDIVDKYLPERREDLEGSEEIERGTFAHAVKLSGRIQKGLLGKLREITYKLPSLHPIEDAGVLHKITISVSLIPLPQTVKNYLPQYFRKGNEEIKVEDK